MSLLRPSNIDGAKHAGAILRLLVKRFRQIWPEVSIQFRGDSAFARPVLLHWCEKNNVDYIVGIAGNARQQALGESLQKLNIMSRAVIFAAYLQIYQAKLTSFMISPIALGVIWKMALNN